MTTNPAEKPTETMLIFAIYGWIAMTRGYELSTPLDAVSPDRDQRLTTECLIGFP